MRPHLSIVIPIFDEEETLPELYQRLAGALESLGLVYELVLVNDGSHDNSFSLMRHLHAKDPRVKYINLSRNFGHQMAITAGLDFASGKAVVVMDGDLQDPPELIPALVAKWQEGFDVVYAVREDREGVSPVRHLLYRAFYRLLRRLSQVDIPLDSGDYRLMSRRVVESLKGMPERNRFMRGLTAWVGLRQDGVPYARPARYAGKAKYSWGKLWRLAMDGVISFSAIPLQLATWLGLTMAVLGACYAFYALYIRIVMKTPPQGWTSLMVVLLVIGGVQLIILGIIGEYIGRIFDEVKRRPLYVVDEACGFDSVKNPRSSLFPEDS